MLTAFTVTFIGWLALFLWAMSLWVCHDFVTAAYAVRCVEALQIHTLTEFEDASLLTRVRQFVLPALKSNTEGFSLQIEGVRNIVTREVASQWKAHAPTEFGQDNGLIHSLDDVRLHLAQSWYLACATGRALLMKLAVLGASLPLFLWASVAGLVDGLNQRAIRTANLGRESTYVFHKAMPVMHRVLAVALTIWLSVPMVMTPSIVFIGLAVVVCLAVSVSASRFKKYV